MLGLKTASRFYSQNTGNPSQFQLDRTETYGYDGNLDYLTSANYNDGLPNANPTWSYDAAGNRNDSVCDNLNRATEIGGVTCTNDILGNRLTKGTTSYTWDALHRMTSIGTSSSYAYRADGMRVSKTVGETTTKYRYDGQMGIEDADSSGVVMNYGIGARGIDYMARTSGTTTAVGFPVYDSHGNMVATLGRSSGNTFTLGNQRSFDAWGSVRSGSGGDPTGRYCGNLGHKQDDESGLIYMRARYYEPTSGRFVSEDVARDGTNWLAYCSNDPVNYSDETGRRKARTDPFLNQLYDALCSFFEAACPIWFLLGVVFLVAGVILMLQGNPDGLPLFLAGPPMMVQGFLVFIFAGPISDFIVDKVQQQRDLFGGFSVVAGFTALGDAGLMLAGLGMGLQTGDADASVWGFF